MHIVKQADWMSARVGDELVMMSPSRGNYVGLSPVGAHIWELLDRTTEFDTLCDLLTGEYDVPAAVCRDEVEAFLNDLVKHGAIAIDPPRPA